jgi:hypothetical protein
MPDAQNASPGFVLRTYLDPEPCPDATASRESKLFMDSKALAMVNEFVKELKSTASGYCCMAQNVCKSCGAELIPGKEFCPKCLVRVPVVPVATTKKQYPKDTPENRAKKMKEYKVIGMEEIWSFDGGGKFNKKGLEDLLNSYGSEGWRVKAIATRQIPGFATLTNESVIILERDMPLEP